MQREPYDLPVAVTKTAAMRYLAETAGHGYVLYQSGTVPAAKLPHLIEKLDSRYRILATRGMRDNDRLRGRSCAKLVVFPKEDGERPGAGTTWLFWLMATEGTGPLPLETNTLDSRHPASRLGWLDQYELVSRPVRRRTGELTHVWTWVFQERFLDRWRLVFKKAAGRMRSSVERKPDYLIKLVTSLRRVPGFHGINRQKRSLILGADIPSALHVLLELRRLGSVVNKALPIFVDERTVGGLTQTESLSPCGRLSN